MGETPPDRSQAAVPLPLVLTLSLNLSLRSRYWSAAPLLLRRRRSAAVEPKSRSDLDSISRRAADLPPAEPPSPSRDPPWQHGPDPPPRAPSPSDSVDLSRDPPPLRCCWQIRVPPSDRSPIRPPAVRPCPIARRPTPTNCHRDRPKLAAVPCCLCRPLPEPCFGMRAAIALGCVLIALIGVLGLWFACNRYKVPGLELKMMIWTYLLKELPTSWIRSGRPSFQLTLLLVLAPSFH